MNSHLETLKSQTNIIVTGDININLIPRQDEPANECKNRANYLNMLSTHGLLPGHTFPTRGPNCLDHFVLNMNQGKLLPHIAVLNSSVTDHSAIFLKLSSLKQKSVCSKTVEHIDYDKAVTLLLEKRLPELLNCDDPNRVTEQLINNLSQSINESKTIKIVPRSRRTIKPWITPGILRCIKNRNKMQSKIKSDPHNEILKLTYKRYRNYCNCLLKKLKRKYEKEELEKASKDSKLLWKTIKDITDIKGNKTQSIELLNIKANHKDSVDFVNDYFANIGKKLAEDILNTNAQSQSNNNAPLSDPNVSSFVLFDTDPLEVCNILKSLKTDSAPGWDNIPTKFLKSVGPVVAPIISHLANLCFTKGIFPNLLKTSIITPVHKGGKRDDVNNYRPISVLPALSKIIEKLLNTRLINYLNKFNILSNSQFGFQRGKSTEDAVLALTTLLTEQLDSKKKCLTVFLDLKKAFDTVSLPILVQKLENIGLRGTPLKLFKDYLNNRTQRVKIGSVTSENSTVSFGVPQGSVLGPTLFLVYLNDLTELNIEGGRVFSYADDTAIVFSGTSWESVFKIAEAGLEKVANWLKQNLLTLNPVKSNYIPFSINKKTEPSDDLKLKIHICDKLDTTHCPCYSLERVTCTKYLGVILDHRLSWHQQIEYTCNRIRKLTWIFKTLRHVTTKKLINQIYKTLAQSVIAYCLTVWGGATKTKFLEVERSQRCLLKIMHFKKYRYPTNELYKFCELLSVRKLYILLIAIRLHRSLPFYPSLATKRRKNTVATSPRTRTKFARRQFSSQSACIYNKIHKILDVYSLNARECKNKIEKWLISLSYADIEKLIQ